MIIPKSKIKTIDNPPNDKVNLDKIKCSTCGKDLSLISFYQTDAKIYRSISYKRMPICKGCMEAQYNDVYATVQDIKSTIYVCCMMYNVPFSLHYYDMTISQCEKPEHNTNPFKTYMQKINSFGKTHDNLTEFDYIEVIDIVKNTTLFSKNIITQTEDIDLDQEQTIYLDDELTTIDKNVKKDVIKMLGYDPFDGYPIPDQKRLYHELLPYLDEDTLEDAFKISVVVSIVDSFNQIRRIDFSINKLSSTDKSLDKASQNIGTLQKIKTSIITSIDKLAKENGISVKNRSDNKSGKSGLTSIMKMYREYGYEDAEQDYYDQKKAIGMKMAADVSNRSILDQLEFDENDINDMINSQRELIQQLQSKLLDVEEKNRQLNVKLQDAT